MAETVQEQQPYQAYTAPIGQLKADRSLIKYILFGLITLGIYPIVFFTGLSSDLNLIASRHDGKKTMHFCLLYFLIGPITCEIASIVWFHKISDRIGNELARRGIPYSFGAKDYWLWAVLGSLILVGPFVYIHKLATATNALAQHYNVNG